MSFLYIARNNGYGEIDPSLYSYGYWGIYYSSDFTATDVYTADIR